MIHFNKNMEMEYKETFQKMTVKKCPECSMSLLDNYLGFIKHLAVDHEKVMKYVKKEEAVTKTTDEETVENDSELKPEANVSEEIAKAETFDIRAILDSDSDSD